MTLPGVLFHDVFKELLLIPNSSLYINRVSSNNRLVIQVFIALDKKDVLWFKPCYANKHLKLTVSSCMYTCAVNEACIFFDVEFKHNTNDRSLSVVMLADLKPCR